MIFVLITLSEKCQISGWGHWSQCSVSCGKGQMSRDRKFLTPVGRKCDTASEVGQCNLRPCSGKNHVKNTTVKNEKII